jgi:hypothetical protein
VNEYDSVSRKAFKFLTTIVSRFLLADAERKPATNWWRELTLGLVVLHDHLLQMTHRAIVLDVDRKMHVTNPTEDGDGVVHSGLRTAVLCCFEIRYFLLMA